jgi:hypothetical protein
MTAARRRKQAPPQVEQRSSYPTVIETYREPRLGDIRHPAPSCFNGDVRIRRYRVIVEVVEEPVEVLRERLITLWRSTERNPHRWEPMQRAALSLGLAEA